MATITLHSVNFVPVNTTNVTAQLSYRKNNAPAGYTSVGSITILPGGAIQGGPVDIVGLLPNMNYQIRVVTTDCTTTFIKVVKTLSDCEEVDISSIQTVQFAPNDFRSVVVNITQSDPSPTIRYQIEVYKGNPSVSGVFMGTYITSGNVSQYIIHDAALTVEGVAYYVRVRALCGDAAQSDWSAYTIYTPCLISSYALARLFDNGTDNILQVKVIADQGSSLDTIYQVEARLTPTGSWIGPFAVTLQDTFTDSGWVSTAVIVSSSLIPLARIASASPNPVDGCNIEFVSE